MLGNKIAFGSPENQTEFSSNLKEGRVFDPPVRKKDASRF